MLVKGAKMAAGIWSLQKEIFVFHIGEGFCYCLIVKEFNAYLLWANDMINFIWF